MTARHTILVVDDQSDICESLCDYLNGIGFDAIGATDAAAARARLASTAVDLVVLDIMMPGEDGLELCRSLRASSAIPIIFLSALGDDTDRIVGLEVGADDYLSKPFNPRELVARIRAILRRSESTPAASSTAPIRSFCGWTLHESQSELRRDDGVIVVLSAGEVDLLCALLSQPDAVMSRDDIMLHAKGRASLAFERSIDNTVSRLRKKIEVDPAAPRIIKTVRGGGYRLLTTEE
ncbi:MAG: response regulator [Pseudomonadota bacterium]